MKKNNLFLFFCCLVCNFVLGQVNHPAISKLRETLPGAAIGLSVQRMSDGKIIAEYQSDVALTPASTAKIIPTALALYTKGGDYRYTTFVFYSGEIQSGILQGNLIVEAVGDPTFDSKYFVDSKIIEPIVTALKNLAIERVTGRIIVNNNLDGSCENIPGYWTWNDIANYYAAAWQPFNFHDNSFTLTLSTGSIGSQAKIKGVYPALPGIEITNKVRSAACTSDNSRIFGCPLSRELHIVGELPPNRNSFTVRGTLFRPGEAFVQELKNKLKEENISVYDSLLLPKMQTALCSVYSPTLGEIAFKTNKLSINLFAEALGYLAVPDYPNVVNRQLNKLKIDTTGISLFDACGLSSFDAIPPRALVQVLKWSYTVCGWKFISSLPLSGTDANLNVYLSAYPKLKNNVRAKTGSFTGVRCLAGYLTKADGSIYIFSIMINHYTCSSAKACNAIGAFLDAL